MLILAIAMQIICSVSILSVHGGTKLPNDTPMPFYVGSSQWNTTAAKSRKVVTIITSVLYSGAWWALGPTTSLTATVALDRLRKLYPNWLPDYEIVFEFADNLCTNYDPISSTIAKVRENDNVENRLPLMILPDCGMFGQRIVGMALNPLNMFGFAFDFEGPRGLIERALYPTFYPMGICADAYPRALAQFMHRVGWRRVAVIGDMDVYNKQLNEILLERFEKLGISLAYYGVVSDLWTGSDAEYMQTFKELAASEPRIIHGSMIITSIFACYLHRFGLFGRGYVITTLAFFAYDDSSDAPTFIAPWCTKKMLFEVLQHMIIFSDITMTQIAGPEYRDETGLRFGDLLNEVYSQIMHPEQLFGPETFIPGDYDRYMFLGLALNETENMLRRRNMTLSDLSTNKPFFKMTGQESFRILKEAFFRTRFTGQSGDFSYNRALDQSSANVPVLFLQKRSEDGLTTLSKLVAYCDSNDTVYFRKDSLVWQTYDGLPPKDRLIVVNVTLPLIKSGASIALKVVASLEIAGFLVLGIAGLKKRPEESRYLDRIDWVLLAGLATMAGHVYAIPIGLQSQISNNCLAISLLICIGFSMVVCGLFAKLRQGLRKQNYAFFLTPIEWAAFQTALLGTVMQTSPFKSSIEPHSYETSPADVSLAFKIWHEECNAVGTLFSTPNLTAQVVMAVAGGLQGCMLGMNVFYTVALLGNLKQNPATSRHIKHLKFLCTSIYQFVLIVVAACFVAVLKLDDEEFLMTTCSAFLLILSALTAALAVATKFLKKPVQPAQKITTGASGRNLHTPSNLNVSTNNKTGQSTNNLSGLGSSKPGKD